MNSFIFIGTYFRGLVKILMDIQFRGYQSMHTSIFGIFKLMAHLYPRNTLNLVSN